MTVYFVPISPKELQTLSARALDVEDTVPLVTWLDGHAIYVQGDGTARWALAELALIRHGLEKRT